jgi:hypothetical protein
VAKKQNGNIPFKCARCMEGKETKDLVSVELNKLINEFLVQIHFQIKFKGGNMNLMTKT